MVTGKRQRCFAAALLLFCLFLNGMTVGADPEVIYSTDLSQFLTGWKLTVGDREYDGDSPTDIPIDYQQAARCRLELTLEENRSLQFETSDAPLTFPLPEGFCIQEDFSALLNVNLGKWGTLANNPLTYDQTTNTLVLHWNTADTEHLTKFRDCSTAVIRISLSGTLGSDSVSQFTIGGKSFPLRREDPHNASVTKEGAYDPVTKTLHYTVTVTSDGTTSDLTLTDTMGTALTYQGDILFDSAASVNTAHTTPSVTPRTGNTFLVQIPLMNDGDTFVFTYSAAVDPDRIAHSGSAAFEETGNTAKISGDSYPNDNIATYYESTIEFSDLVKDSLGVTTEYRDGVGYGNIRWEIVTNKNGMYPLSGTDITDTLDESIRNVSAYWGDGVEILCYANHNLMERRFLPWSELGIDPQTDKSWTYHIPKNDPNYEYVLHYQTTVNMENRTSSLVVKNTAAGKGGIDSAYEVISPLGGNLGISKTASALSADSVTWEIKLHLKDKAFERSELILTEHQNSKKEGDAVTWESDHLPYKWLNPDNAANSTLYKETLDTLEVIGLYEDETFVLHYGGMSSQQLVPETRDAGVERRLVADPSWHSDRWTPEKLSIEFYQNLEKTKGGLHAPTDGTADRTITIRLKTHFPEEWAQEAKRQNTNRMENITWYYEHLNWADIAGVYDVAKIAPYPVGVYKRVLRDASSQSGKSTNMVRNGRVYPVYYYQVLVSGVESDTPLVIDDVFDTSIFELYKPHEGVQLSQKDYLEGGVPSSWDNWYLTKFGGLSEFDWMNEGLGTFTILDGGTNQDFTQEETDDGVRFTFLKFPKDENDQYYQFYGVQYWLTAKDEEALKKIEEMAAASPTHEAVFLNTASCRGESARARAALKSLNDFTPIEKISEQFIEYADGTRSSPENLVPNKPVKRYGIKYRIDLNRGQEELNGGADIVAEDSYTADLSVDFQTISISTVPANRTVSYDFSGNVGYFTIPDKTHVTIEYEATVISPEENTDLTVGNTVTMLGSSKTKTDEVHDTGFLWSSALNPSIFIKKYERGHMESGLNGAVFQLYRRKDGAAGNTENDWEPMVYADTYSPTGNGSVPNPNRGKPITFTTGNLTIGGTHYGDGYANVELTNTVHGLNLEYGTTYGLREIESPVRQAGNGETVHYQSPHHDGFFCYQFTLTQHPTGVDYSQYIFRPDEILTVKNDPDSVGVRLKKEFGGTCVLTDGEKNQLSYQLYSKQENGKYQPLTTTNHQNETIINPHFVNIRYEDVAQAENGYLLEGLKLAPGAEIGEFLLVERGSEGILASHPDWRWTGVYEWDHGSTGTFSKSFYTVYDHNGQHPQQVYGVVFEITRQNMLENERKCVTLTNQYTVETVTLKANKKWMNPDGSALDFPKGRTVTFELGTVEDGSFIKLDTVPPITLDGKPDNNGEEVPGTAVFRDLPRYVPGTADLPIGYAVREAASVEGYHTVYPQSGADFAVFDTTNAVTIRNQAEAVTVTVHKQWQTLTGTTPPAGARAVLRLYAYPGTDASKAYWVHTVNDITLDGTADEQGETSPWTASFQNLPQVDASGERLTYLVKEESCQPAGFAAAEEFVPNEGTMTNRFSTADLTITKQVSGSLGSKMKEFGFTVSFVLPDQQQSYQGKIPYEKTSADGTITDGELTVDSQGTVSFKLRHGETICLKALPLCLHYTVEETDSADGYTTTVAPNGGTPSETRTVQWELTKDTTLAFHNRRDGAVPTNLNIHVPVGFCAAAAGALFTVIVWAVIRHKKDAFHRSANISST